ncbi:hypothetical protein SAMN05443572_102630 [Myxococcus fulvus]|uniref:Uncharacterized protein n=1 Tax=Myxococcus fulvus TaxID=33 RepID=A0A511SWH6_MYXFU|nr:hypothetical protein [Myxococcus fulvus]GEN06259.1 hypothetical protein MFU01_12960 [Myxococcus fulvus]SET54043.1 hypothetical protein SAMN05443572_102630 [Myxococcus fulvus]
MAQLLLAVVLFAAVPYAMSMVPFERIYTDGAYNAPHTEDPLFPVRWRLIALGAWVPVLSMPFAVLAWKRRHAHLELWLLQVSLLLCVCVIGWRNFPYYVLGIYRAYLGEARVADFDPKGLLEPYRSTGYVPDWEMLLLYPVALVAVPLIGYRLFQERKRMSRAFVLGIAMCLATTVFAFLSTPGFSDWLVD